MILHSHATSHGTITSFIIFTRILCYFIVTIVCLSFPTIAKTQVNIIIFPDRHLQESFSFLNHFLQILHRTYLRMHVGYRYRRFCTLCRYLSPHVGAKPRKLLHRNLNCTRDIQVFSYNLKALSALTQYSCRLLAELSIMK